MKRIFPELKENMMSFQLIRSMPIVTMDGEQIVYVPTAEVANEYEKAIIDKIWGKEIVYYGLDAVWCRGNAANSTPLFQCSFPEGDAVIFLHLPLMHDFPKKSK